MALHCRKLHQPNPFETRKIFVQQMPESNPAQRVESSEAKTEQEKLATKIQAIRIPEIAQGYLKKLNELYAKGEFTQKDRDNFNGMLANYEWAQSIEDAAERKRALDQLNQIYGDFELTGIEGELGAKYLLKVQSHVDERLALRNAHLDRNKVYVFLTDLSGQNRLKSEDEIRAGIAFKVDFGGNLAAERSVGLKDLVPDSINHVTVGKKDGGTVEAYRGTNGNFFTTKNQYVSVYTGDTYTVPTEPTVASMTVKQAADKESDARIVRATAGDVRANLELQQEDARKRAEATAEAEATYYRTVLLSAQSLEKGSRTEVPAEMQGLNKFNYSEQMREFNYGDQIVPALERLGQLRGDARISKYAEPQSSAIDVWEDIRRQQLRKEVVSYNEICQAILNKSPRTFSDEIKAVKNLIELYGIDLTHVQDTGVQEAILNKIETLKSKLNAMEEFLIASQQLMDAIPKLKQREHARRDIEKREKSEEEVKAERLLAQIFDPENQGPVVKVNILRQIFRGLPRGQVMNMDLFTESAKYNTELDQYMAEAGAFNMLHQEIVRPEGAKDVIDQAGLDKLIARLNELRLKGLLAASNNPELMEEFEGATMEEKIAKLKASPLTKDLLDNPNSLGESSRELIRQGMAMEQGEKYLEQKNSAIESLKAQYPVSGELVEGLATVYNFTPEQLTEMAAKLHEHFLAAALLKINLHEEDKASFGLGLDVPIDLGHGVKFHAGFSEDVLNGYFTLHAGLAKRFDAGRVHLTPGIGVQEMAGKVGAGAGLQVSVDLGQRYEAAGKEVSVYGLEAGAMVGVQPSPQDMFLGIFVNLGVSRNLQAVLEKKEAKLTEQQESMVKQAVETYTNEIKMNNPGLTEGQVTQLVDQMREVIATNVSSQGIDNMDAIQFLGFNMGANVLSPLSWMSLIPFVKFAIKGKKYIVYGNPPNPGLRGVSDALIEAELAKMEGTDVAFSPVYLSGTLEMRQNGTRTIHGSARGSELLGPKLESLNKTLSSHGVEIKATQMENQKVRLTLAVGRVNGIVNVYTDPAANFETYVAENGDVVVNLDQADLFSVRRVDEFFPFQRSEQFQHTNIYLTNNIFNTNKVIETAATEHLQYVKTATRFTKAELVQSREAILLGAESRTFASEEELIAQGGFLGDISADLSDREAAQTKMWEAIGKEFNPELNSTQKSQLQRLAHQVVEENKIDYRKLSTERSPAATQKLYEMVKAANGGKDLNNTAFTYVIQEMMVASLSTAKEDSDFAEHIRTWNTQVLAEGLIANGLKPEATAKAIAEKIMRAYADSLAKLQREGGKAVSESDIEAGSIVHVQVGTMNIKGYREAFADPSTIFKLLGQQNLDIPTLTGHLFNLTEAEAKAFIEATSRQLDPFSDSPEVAFQSQLGLYLLDSADFIFGAKKTEKLAEMVIDKSLVANPEYNPIYQEYLDLLKELRANGKASLKNGLLLRVDSSQTMGFNNQCRNFTLTKNSRLVISVPQGMAVSKDVRDYLRGHPGIRFYGLGVAVTVESKDKPKRHKPEEEKTEGEKEPGGAVLEGQIKTPDEIRGELGGHGGQAPA